MLEQVSLGIQNLTLRHNLINKYPQLILRFTGLVVLDLSDNRLMYVPKEILEFPCLKELHLNNNLINLLPPQMYLLQSLRLLSLSYNWLSQIPHDLPWHQLHSVYLDRNQFERLPIQLRGLVENCINVRLDWFRYAQPELPLHFEIGLNSVVFTRLINKLTELQSEGQQHISFQQFVRACSEQAFNLLHVDQRGKNLLFQATQDDNLGVIRVLAKMHPFMMEACDNDKHTALSLALLDQRLRSVIVLLECGVDPNQRNGSFGTCLHLAVYKKSVDMVQKLVSLGADPNIRDRDGNTPLHLLFNQWSKGGDQHPSKLIAEILLNAAIQPNLKNNDKWTPLHLAIRKLQVGAITFAIQYNLSNPPHRKKSSRHQFFDFTKKGGLAGLTIIQMAASTGVVDIIAAIYQLNSVQTTDPNYIDILALSKSGHSLDSLCYPALVLKKWSRKIYRYALIRQVATNSSKKAAPKSLNSFQKMHINNGDQMVEDSIYDNETFQIPSLSDIDAGTQVSKMQFTTYFQKKQNVLHDTVNVRSELTRIKDEILAHTTIDRCHRVAILAQLQAKINNPSIKLPSKQFNHLLTSPVIKIHIHDCMREIISALSNQVQLHVSQQQQHIHPELSIEGLTTPNIQRANIILQYSKDESFRRVKYHPNHSEFASLMVLEQTLNVNHPINGEQSKLLQNKLSHSNRLTILQYEILQQGKKPHLTPFVVRHQTPLIVGSRTLKETLLSVRQPDKYSNREHIKTIADEQKINLSHHTQITTSPFRRRRK